MKNRSPAKIVELCIYVIIIAAVTWMLADGKLYKPPEITPPAVTQAAEQSEPPIVVPRPLLAVRTKAFAWCGGEALRHDERRRALCLASAGSGGHGQITISLG